MMDRTMQASRFARLLRSPQRMWQFRRGLVGQAATRASHWLGAARSSYPVQRALVSYGRKRDWICPNSFLILGTVRSGTTLLSDYLNCHARVHCRGEILNPDYQYYGNPRGMDRQRLALHVESFFVKRPGRLAGAKLMTYQLDEMPITLGEIVDVLGQPRVIVLYRQRILEQYASLKLAERDNMWHVNKPVDSRPIWIDPKSLLAFAQRERRMWRDNAPTLAQVPAHYLSYEQLTSDGARAMRGVFDFLGLDSCPVDSWLVRQNPKPLESKVVNHASLVAAGLADATQLRLPLGEPVEQPTASDGQMHLAATA